MWLTPALQSQLDPSSTPKALSNPRALAHLAEVEGTHACSAVDHSATGPSVWSMRSAQVLGNLQQEKEAPRELKKLQRPPRSAGRVFTNRRSAHATEAKCLRSQIHRRAA